MRRSKGVKNQYEDNLIPAQIRRRHLHISVNEETPFSFQYHHVEVLESGGKVCHPTKEHIGL